MRLTMFILVPVITIVPAAVISSAAMSTAVATVQPEAPPGRAPYARVCAACHGDSAEGSQGPRLAGIAIEYDEFLAKVRHGGGEMPSMSRTQITDEEVKQAFDYLQSL